MSRLRNRSAFDFGLNAKIHALSPYAAPARISLAQFSHLAAVFPRAPPLVLVIATRGSRAPKVDCACFAAHSTQHTRL